MTTSGTTGSQPVEELAYTESFERYAAQSAPEAWLDSSAGRFKTFDDPLVPGNMVYGAKHPSPRQRSAYRRPPGDAPDLGAYTTLSGRAFALGAGFELRGRFLRATDASLAGITFFSSQPESKSYRMLALWRTATDTAATMRLYSSNGVLRENARSSITPAPMQWHRFVVRADAAGIRARVWREGTEEPHTWAIDFVDPELTGATGRIGLWSAVGAAYFDDLMVIAAADEEVDTTAPTIVFSESGEVISGVEAFNRDARVEVRALDGSGVRSLTITLDGKPYESGSPITAEARHVLRARAEDTRGNVGEAEITITVDKTPPVIAIAPIAPFVNQSVTPSIDVRDLSATAVTLTLDDAPFIVGTLIDAERTHTLVARAEDEVGWKSDASVTFTIDRTAPLIAIAPIAPFTNHDVMPDVTVSEPSTLSITLNGAAFTSGTVVTEERAHALTATATDRAGNTDTAAAAFTIDRTKPIVDITPIAPFTSQHVTPEITVNEPATWSMTLNGAAFTIGTVITEEREHALAATATDRAGNIGTAQVAFTIDRGVPVVTIAPIAPFTNQDVTPDVTVNEPATMLITLNGAAFTIGTVITEEREHALAATATDRAGNIGTAGAAFTIDRTNPVVIIAPIAPLTKENVTPQISVSESAELTATLNGAAFDAGSTITEERPHALAVTATDAAGNTGSDSATFTIDRTPPMIAFTSPAADARLGTRRVKVTGTAPDAVSVLVNGVPATVESDGTFSAEADLLEGANEIVALAADAAGNGASRALRVHLDTRAPALDVLSPAANACVASADVTLRGTAVDASGVTVRIADAAPIVATLNGTEWSATVPVNEGAIAVTINATDAGGHITTLVHPLRVDRTKPVITASESGAPFAILLHRRAVAPFVRVADADAHATLSVTLDGVPFASGNVVNGEGTHVLRATATDCAGNSATPFELTFTIDRTPPSIVSITPAAGASIGVKPPVTGTLSEPATLNVEGTTINATRNGTSFSLDVPFEEGFNELALLATDAAGNSSRTAYTLRVDTTRPSVEIVENGLPIAPGVLLNRAVTPVIRVSDLSATLVATLNGQPFPSGASITADASYTLTAKATDAFGRASDEAKATFTIDRTPPHIDITAPADGSFAAGELLEVRGGVDTDAESVSVNGTAAVITGATFAATIRIEEGPNVLIATASDRAGNSSRDHVAVVRNSGRLALLITSPPDGMVTNRATTVVAGQVLNAPPSGHVRINTRDVAVDAAGAFRDVAFPLVEGVNAITVEVASARGEVNAVTVNVTADFTPPPLVLTANGQPLQDGARFAIAPRIALETSDDAWATLTVDGTVITGEVVLGDGGQALSAIARDAAGNEARIDRTLFVGTTLTIGDCAFTQLDPIDGSVVFTDIARITGRSGGAVSVLINGNAAQVADGSFCGDATLVGGRNEVTLRCADSNGNPTSDAPVTLVLWRDVEPSIAITGTNVTSNTVTVEGTVSAGVVSGDVNGVAFALPQGTTFFSMPNIALSPGLNIITARAKSGSGRTAIATARVRHLAGTPQLAITSPIAGTETGALSLDVTGTYVNVDPASIRVNGAAASTTANSDTSGTFRAMATLASGALTTIVTSANGVTASVQVQHIVGAPSLAITSPVDNSFLGSTFAGPLAVSGTFTAPEGSQLLVNGVTATLSGDAFSASVPVSTGAAPMPILARITTPESISATDTVRIVRFAAPLALRDSFPSANAIGVDRGIAILTLFNNALDAATASSAIRLTDASNTDVAGQVFVDRDAITFAPDAPLRANETYTMSISTALHDASGAALAAAQARQFTTAAIAPATAPIVDEVVTSGCLSAITLTGRASIPGARVRLGADGITLTTVSSESGAFKFTFSFSGEPGFHVARVREIGADGSLSAERALCFRINCDLPRVLGASLHRTARKVTIDFSRTMDASTLIASANGTIRIVPDGLSAMHGAVVYDANTATVTLDADVPDVPVTLTVAKHARDVSGVTMAADYTQRFLLDPTGAQQGRGYVAGAVYDATTGRPLANASVTIGDAVVTTNDRGRYSRALAEGAWTIEARADGYTSAWRQVVVPAGAGVVPIDIRLTRRNTANTLTHGGDTTVTKRVDLAFASPSPNVNVHVSAVGAQSLAGLLPLGWSPLAAAEVVADDSLDAALTAATITFHIDDDAVRAAAQTLSLVRYERARDEWRVVVSAVNIADDGRVAISIADAGHYALVYPDAAPHLEHPAQPRNGAPLSGVSDRCASQPCALTGRSFALEPRAILPSGRATATLITEGATQSYASGTAVQATIDEQLNLSDGRVIADAPFATDLLVYRTLDGGSGVADFHLSPTTTASSVMLRDGVERIRITDYPGRLDRGALLGAQGGRITGGGFTLDVPPGATIEPLHASTTPLTDVDLGAFGSIAGFRIAGGFTLALTRATEPPAGEVAPAAPALLIPAHATFTVANELLVTTQVIVAEVLTSATHGLSFELVAIADPGAAVSGARLFTTRAIDSTQLPIDGITRDGRYVILVAESPIAFAYGQVRAGVDGVTIANARVTAGIGKPMTSALGVTSVTTAGGLFALPVAAAPAAPFSLVARATSTGDSATAVASTTPAARAFVPFGVLPLVAQPPQLRSVSPDGGEVAVDAAFRVRAEFDVAVDSVSVTGGIHVVNLTSGEAMTGTVSAAGNVVTFDPAEPLRAASQYAITIHSTIRGANGAPFAQTVVKSFTTSARPRGSTAFNVDRIRITIPDASGRSTIHGAAGALPAGSQAIAVRRGRFFIVGYQATVAADGSFSFDAGHGDARDAITIDDVIDLQVVDPISHAVVAIVELTPFVRDDARAFIARHDRDTRFVSADGIIINVPKGAFDVPTLTAATPAAESAFVDVPSFGSELGYATSAELTFEGVAKKRIDVELPIPATLDPANRNWLVARLGTSMRGPRLMIVDFAHANGSTFRTGPSGATGSQPVGALASLSAAATSSTDLRNHLLGINRSGVYAVVDIKVPQGSTLAWGVMEGLQAGVDLFWDTAESLYASNFYLTEGRGTIAVPLITNKPFVLVGVDVASGLDIFRKVYDPIPVGVPGAPVDVADPNPDRSGPYPVFASPFRVETLELVAEGSDSSVRDFDVTLKNERVVVTSTLAQDVNVTLFNVTRGLVDASRTDGLKLAADKGDRIALLIAERDVDPNAAISIVFDEPIDAENLAGVISIETAPADGGAFVPITGALSLRIDANGRRVLIEPPASLVRGNRYRVAISRELANTKGLLIGQTRDANGNIVGGLFEPLYLEMQVRVPGDLRASFDLQSGVIRDQALVGNVLFVAAGEGGLAAYDVADPAGMKTGSAPIARVANGATDYWSLAADHHGRVYATGITSLFGVVHSYRLEHFLANAPALQGGVAVSYVPGSSSGMEVASRSVSGDRVEAYPRRLQILVQDETIDLTGEELQSFPGVTLQSSEGEFRMLDASFARDVARPYATQRITVENVTLDLRWSADATVSQPAHITGMVVRATDQVRVIRNQTTYGVVSLFGYGVGVYDLNAVDSNDAPEKPHGYKPLREQVRVTRAQLRPECGAADTNAIPDLTFSPDATIVTRAGTNALHVLALDASRGVLDLTIDPSSDASPCGERAPIGLLLRDDARLAKLRERFIQHTNRAPFVRFTGAARHRPANADTQRDYMLIPANEYGLLVVEIAGDPPPVLVPSYTPLQPIHLVDVIWIPHGAYAARAIPNSNLATVTDGEGHVLLVDLTRIDERWNGAALIPSDELFATAKSVLEENIHTPDPRIVWRSARPLAGGTLAPGVDANTGFVFAGKLLEKATSVIAATDPRVRLIDLTHRAELHAVPAAFRVELSLPGAANESMPEGLLTFDIDSERRGVKTEDTPDGWPRAHLERLQFHRAIPGAARHQRGFNRWISDPVVALPDVRASKDYTWPAGVDKAAEGCYACDRPAVIADDSTVREIFALGDRFRLRPSSGAFANSPYRHLAERRRLETVVPATAADVVHPPRMLTAAQYPAVAGGMLQGTTHLHSGELETSVTDFDFGGRAGWNVAITRTYRSRTVGLSPLGAGWDASIFQRLRVLPNGDVEYRDGTGEVWLFRPQGAGRYSAPIGLFLNLTKTERGYAMIDQAQRLTTFDSFGRLASESDEFFDPAKPGSGNNIHYLYGGDGRLAAIVDPVGRRTTLAWNANGLLAEIADWRARKITYEYDAHRRLTRVHLPEVTNTSGARPRIAYSYQDAGSSLNDRLELATNLTSIKDPKEVLGSGSPRVTFVYPSNGVDRDRVVRQEWGSGEFATIAYDLPAHATVKDILGQERRYTLTANVTNDLRADRAHVTAITEVGVPVWSGAAFGQLPASLLAGAPALSTVDRTRTFAFVNGALQSSKMDGVVETSVAYQAATAGVGMLVKSTTTTPAASAPSNVIPPAMPIARTMHYQPGSNFLASIEAGGKTIHSVEPHRGNTTPTTTNSDIVSRQTFDDHGLVTVATSTGGTDTASAGAKEAIEYFDDTAALHARGLPRRLRAGDGTDALDTTIEYPSAAQTREIDPRGVITTTDLDAWQRPVFVRVERPGDPLSLEQSFHYDATGRLERTTKKKDAELVVTSDTYDVMGRRTSSSTTGMATVGSVTMRTAYDLNSRAITTTHAGGATTRSELDSLGRTRRTVTQTGSSPIEQQFAYDLAGNRVFATDMLTASASAFDAHGRAVATRAMDGTLTTAAFDEWNRPKNVRSLADDAATTVAESSYAFTDAGRAKAIITTIDAGVQRTIAYGWDGAGRTTRTAVGGRASSAVFDLAGRMQSHAAGAGNIGALTEIFERSVVKANSGDLPVTIESSEKSGAVYTSSMERNTTGDVVRENVASLEWQRRFDELGNVTQATVPGRPATNWKVDARGAVETETKPDGATHQFAYDAIGAQTNFTDPTSEATNTVADLIGRPLTRTYPDGTTEKFEWEGSRLKSSTDRQNRIQVYRYNEKGQLREIHDGAGTPIDLWSYDNAGRLVSWKNADAEITWGQFDLDGNPKQTTQVRFANASGLSASPVVLDELTQQHRWNEHGERVQFSMPASGDAGAGWTKWLRQTFDAMGNVTGIARADDETATTSVPVMTANYRAAGRPDVRSVFTAGSPIVRTYDYDAATSLLSRVDVSVNGQTIAGSEVAYDGLQKSQSRLLGISSGERFTRYVYDDRSRLAASVFGTRAAANPSAAIPGRARELLTPADFRTAQERTPALESAIGPPTSTFAEQPGGGHKIARMEQGPLVLPFAYDGAERIDDGRFIYAFDVKGRLISATEKRSGPPLRRAIYSYSGTGRLVGRRAEYATIPGEWKLEEDTTFAWDPISDRLLAVYRAGATETPLKQIIHGDSAYDDPLEVTSGTGRLYPIYDEAAAGSLQAVLDDRAELVVRNIPNDPYGADDVTLAGVAIDAVNITATTDTIEVTLHATEALDPSTITTGARLALVDATGALVRLAPAVPSLSDPFTIRWTMTAAEWSTFTAAAAPPATALSIAATNTLRASAWSASTPILPPPDWAPAFASPALPFEIREPLASVTASLASATRISLYDIPILPVLGATSATPLDDIAATRFHAHPLTDPLTGLNYVRNRWFDPGTGTWLSPDPKGYVDSSNLYAFAGGDPVNGRDPTGLAKQASCLGFGTKSCGDLGREITEDVVESIGFDEVFDTGSPEIDAKLSKYSKASVRLAMSPGNYALANGELGGEIAYRMERSTFHGEQAFDGSVDDALLIAGAMGEAAVVVAPLGTLEGGISRVAKPRTTQTKVTPTSGNTPQAAMGTRVHAEQANLRRQTDVFDAVNEPIRDLSGNAIRVPRRVDLRTGAPVTARGTQVARPDAVSYGRLLIVDDKPLGRNVLVKDRQEMIRFIRAFEAREGRLPKTIGIQVYDPTTGLPVRTDLYTPDHFLPKAVGR